MGGWEGCYGRQSVVCRQRGRYCEPASNRARSFPAVAQVKLYLTWRWGWRVRKRCALSTVAFSEEKAPFQNKGLAEPINSITRASHQLPLKQVPVQGVLSSCPRTLVRYSGQSARSTQVKAGWRGYPMQLLKTRLFLTTTG
jgi:hypothetical protein